MCVCVCARVKLEVCGKLQGAREEDTCRRRGEDEKARRTVRERWRNPAWTPEYYTHTVGET